MYEIDRNLDIPLYIQIRDAIVTAINEESLRPGDRLPAVSHLAKSIGVTQATIRRALQDLVEAGHTECCVGRGTFILDANEAEQSVRSTSASAVFMEPDDEMSQRATHHKSREHAARRLRHGVSKALYDIMPLVQKPGIIAFTRGTPDEKMICDSFMTEVCQETLDAGPSSYVQATDTAGLYALREEIAKRASADGTLVTPDMVMITNGVMQAISLIAQHAMEQQPEILCETPCFQGIPNSFSAMGHWVETVQRDEQGPIMEQLERYSEKRPRLLYVCPYAHNPMGTNLHPQRYEQLVEWAWRSGTVVIADEIFRELNFSDSAQRSILAKLGSEQTIVVSSMSKSIMTGLRIGWIITSARRIQELTQLKRLMDHSTPSFTQGMALSIFRSGKFDGHIHKMQQIYRSRMDTLLKSLKKMMPKQMRWSQPDGGYSMMLELPHGYSSVALLFSAIEMGVSFLPGPLFDIDQRYAHGIRLSVACSDEHEIKEGIELLASVLEAFLSSPPRDTGLSGLGGFQ